MTSPRIAAATPINSAATAYPAKPNNCAVKSIVNTAQNAGAGMAIRRRAVPSRDRLHTMVNPNHYQKQMLPDKVVSNVRCNRTD